MRKLYSIQILRGFACLFVVFAHIVMLQAKSTTFDAKTLLIVQHIGDFAVCLFFMISGFIMIHTAYAEFGEGGAVKRFVVTRLARIVPLYWIATFFELLLNARHGKGWQLDKLFQSLFFIPQDASAGSPFMRPILGVGWTLNYEMYFYILFACAMFFKRGLGLSLLFAAMLGIVTAGTFLKPLSDTHEPTTALTFLTSPIILLFAIGMTLGLVAKVAPRLTSVRPANLVLVCVVAGVLADIIIFSRYVDVHPTPLGWLICVWMLSAICIGLGVFLQMDGLTLLTRPLVKLGDMSYSLYLFHFVIISATAKVWVLAKLPIGSWLFVPAAVSASIVVSFVIYHFVEAPIDRWLRPRHRLKQSDGAVTPPAAGAAGLAAAMR